MPGIRLERMVLEFFGDFREFLGGLTTNRLEAPQSAFIDVKGRIIALCDQVGVAPDRHWIIVATACADRLQRHLEKYLVLSDVRMTKRDLKVYFYSEEAPTLAPGEFRIPQKKGCLVVSGEDREASWSSEAFTLFRVQNGIPLQGMDFDEEMLLNVDEETHVSYDKGCYLGQEIIARIHSRLRPPKKLIVKYEGECTEEEKRSLTSKVRDPGNGRWKGFVFVPNREVQAAG